LPEWLPARSPSPEYHAVVRERVEHVLKRMEKLPLRRRMIIEGLAAEKDLREIAGDVGLTISNAHKLKRLAREDLCKPGRPWPWFPSPTSMATSKAENLPR